MNQGQAPPSLPSARPVSTHPKDPPLTVDVIGKIADIQNKIDKLSTQLKEAELKDSTREQRLQSVLVAKQK